MASAPRRSRDELGASAALIEAGFPDQASSRAYYAAFHAAAGALLCLGEARSKHSGVLAAFGRRVIKEGGLDPGYGRALRDLFEARNDVDYALDPASESDARETLAQAQHFVTAVEAWIADKYEAWMSAK
ncbi:MAG: HEPN domain-containing protein [Actinomycetota bacterium]|nr:HEPN domain-containing protein [Actinomycetota bacterium]MDQ3647243.1 HEPN domain-containing protein [Actinomycetota bacterium]